MNVGEHRRALPRIREISANLHGAYSPALFLKRNPAHFRCFRL